MEGLVNSSIYHPSQSRNDCDDSQCINSDAKIIYRDDSFNENGASASDLDENSLMTDGPLLNSVRVYGIRWIILILFCLVTMSNAMLWISLSAITDIVERYYGVHAIYVDWLSLAFIIMPGVMSIPGTYLVARLGLKTSVVLPAGMHAIGTAIRICGTDRENFWFVATGQFIVSLGTIFILIIPPRLSAVWFGEHERTSATTIGMMFNIFGVSSGFLLSCLLVPDTRSLDRTTDGFRNLYWTHAIFCFGLFFLVLLLVRDAPPSPPSRSEAARKTSEGTEITASFNYTVVELLKNCHYMLIVISYSLNFGLIAGLPTLLNQMIKVQSKCKCYPVSEESIGWVGFAGPLGGIVGSFVAGKLLDSWKRYKIVTCVSFFITTASLVAFSQLLLQSKSIFWIAFTFVLVCVFGFQYFAYGLDHVAEVAYPASEASAAAIPMILSNTVAFVLIYIMQTIIDDGYLNVVLYVFIGIEVLAILLSLVAKTEMKRQDADNS